MLEAETFILDDVEDKLYDLIAKDTVKLSITQPEYGFTAATTYTVEVSLNEDFEENSFKTLSTTYNNTTIKLLPNISTIHRTIDGSISLFTKKG